MSFNTFLNLNLTIIFSDFLTLYLKEKSYCILSIKISVYCLNKIGSVFLFFVYKSIILVEPTGI